MTCESCNPNSKPSCKACSISKIFETAQLFCDRRSLTAISENKSKWIFENPNSKCVCHIKVEGGVISQDDPQNKCDDLFLVCHAAHKSAFFVELKGKNLEHSLLQLTNTIPRLQSELHEFCLHVRVALTKTPKIESPKEKHLKRQIVELKKRYKKCECGADCYFAHNATGPGYTEVVE